ncbi:MAG: DUF58 domain-containing protein [Bdellovibrionaceae bacterium]|jgi:uncharacterized protein (DUF58 family)|nr:DUF58 domain-containing protein [Pseudobdellovibrionaceae bacterium]
MKLSGKKWLSWSPPWNQAGMSSTKEEEWQRVLELIQDIETKVRFRVNDQFLGQWRARFKGQGMTFADFREYVPGDDTRHISWVATARTGRTIIKQYEEERETHVILVVDHSLSMRMGSQFYPKTMMSALVAGVLSQSALKTKDLVGLLLFSNGVDLWVPPKKGRAHFRRLLRDILHSEPAAGSSTDLSVALRYLRKILNKKSLIFVISDFVSLPQFDVEWRLLRQKHEIYPIWIQDPWEVELPEGAGLLGVRDPETGRTVLWDTSLYDVRESYAQGALKRQEELQIRFQALGSQLVKIVSQESSWFHDLRKGLSLAQGIS